METRPGLVEVMERGVGCLQRVKVQVVVHVQ